MWGVTISVSCSCTLSTSPIVTRVHDKDASAVTSLISLNTLFVTLALDFSSHGCIVSWSIYFILTQKRANSFLVVDVGFNGAKIPVVTEYGVLEKKKPRSTPNGKRCYCCKDRLMVETYEK